MKKPNSRIMLTDNPHELLSLSKNMERENNSMRFVTTSGNKRILSLDEIFTKREFSLRCLKTDKTPPYRYVCSFQKAYDLVPLVQFFSWNSAANAIMYLGDIDYPELADNLEFFDNLENCANSNVSLTISEHRDASSIGFSAEMGNRVIGVIIDYVKKSEEIEPFKIFCMALPEDGKNLEIFYTNPHMEDKSYGLAKSLIKKYSMQNG